MTGDMDQQDDAHLTLREAIAAHRARVGGDLIEIDDPAIAPLFDGHDAAHALFGCHTTVHDEALVDTWTLVASDVGFRRYLAYLNHPTLRALLDSYPRGLLVRESIAALPDVCRVLWRAWRMPRRWSFDAWAEHLDERIGTLRADYGIRPIGR